MTDFRALCEDLLQPLSEYDDANPYHDHRSLIDRARTALDEQTPSLKEQALKALKRVPGPGADSTYLRQWSRAEAASLINDVRRALEALPND